MNELIQKLAQQSGLIASTHNNLDFKTNLTPSEKKFAKLIINECLEIIEKQFGGGDGDGVEWDRAIEFTYDDVKKQFGIEQ